MRKEISPGLAAAVIIVVVVVALVALIMFTNPRGGKSRVQPAAGQPSEPPKPIVPGAGG